MRGFRKAVAPSMAACVAVILVNFLGSRTAFASPNPTTRALLYLQTQQSVTDGSLNSGDFFSSELYAIGAAAGGYDPKVLRNGSGPSVMAFLSSNATSACPQATDPHPSAGRCGALLQSIAAAGLDPHNFGGIDVATRLTAYLDSATGGYGDHEAFTQALAMQGLVASGASIPPVAVNFVKNAQDSDGGWNFKAVKNDSAGSDTNSTAMLLMALDATSEHSRDHAALQWLHSQQNSDGGFAFQGATPAPPSDPDSTALVVQAIIGAGGNPDGSSWAVGGHTPAGELLATQDVSGGYVFPGSTGPDGFTTAQVPPALDGVAFPAPFATHEFYEAGATLPAQTNPSTTPSPSPQVSSGTQGATAPPTPQNGATAVAPGVALGIAIAGAGFIVMAAWRSRRR